MKKLYLYAGMAIMAIMMILVTSSCSKSDDGGGGEKGDATLIGSWCMTFQGSKGNGYVILTFAQNGNGLYQEYDNFKWQHNDIFTYSYSNGKLTVKWGIDDTKVIEVVSLTKAQLVLKDFPDKGTNTFYVLTPDMEALLDNL